MRFCIRFCTIFLLSFTSVTAFAEDKEPSICEPVFKCQEKFKKHNCSDLATNEIGQSRLRMCTVDEITKRKLDTVFDVVTSCGTGAGTEAVAIGKGILNLPFAMGQDLESTSERMLAAQTYCTQFLHLKAAPYYVNRQGLDLKSPEGKITNDWDRCVARVSNDGSKMKFPSYQKIKSSLREVAEATTCFKSDSIARIVCPVIASILAGALEGYALKKMLIFVANQAAIQGTNTALDVTARASELRKVAVANKEILSVNHTLDLVVSTESYAGEKLFANLGMDLRQTQIAMLNSDSGKILSVWTEKILSPSSENVLKVLSGQSNSQAARALKELLDHTALKGKTLLPNIPIDQLRTVLKQNPNLMTGLIHQVPGLGDAIAAYDANVINLEQFKTQVGAILGHDGTKGFTDVMQNKIVPDMLKNQDEVAKKFFKGTIFEGETNADGVVVPKYPAPITKEGVFHTIVDRLSQATRGGVTKIYEEIGAPSGRNRGLIEAAELMNTNQIRTIEQLEDLKKNIAKMPSFEENQMNGLTKSQRETLTSVADDGIERIRLQKSFLDVAYDTKEKTLSFVYPKGKPNAKVITLNEDASSEEIYDAMKKAFDAEEKANKEPLSSFIKVSFGPAIARPAAFGLADLPLVCQSYKKDEKISPVEKAPVENSATRDTHHVN